MVIGTDIDRLGFGGVADLGIRESFLDE